MAENLTATASTTINAPKSEVWDALVTPEAIKEYMFGTDVSSEWREGSGIHRDDQAGRRRRTYTGGSDAGQEHV